jgi:integrase
MAHHVFKPRRTRNGKPVISRVWWGQYRLDGDSKYTRFSLKTTDKRVAQAKLDELVKREERLRAGILAPEAQTAAATKPIAEHLTEFVQYLRSSNRSRGYYRKVEQRVTRLMNECGWKLLRDVTAASFIAWRAEQTLAPKTVNDYQDAIGALLNWLKQTDRINVNPLERVGKVDGRGRRTFVRRAFTDDELKRLIQVSGPRGIVYTVAAKTGLRHGELLKLQWGDLDFDGSVPVVRVRAATTKNRKDAVIPLAADVVEALRAWRPEESRSTSLVFPRMVPNRHRVTEDLEAAGIERWRDGKKVDFHALRTTFVTNLQRAGISRRVAMELARHSDSRLTDRVYTDESALLTADAIAKLPQVWSEKAAHIDAHGAAQRAVSRGHSVSHTDADLEGADGPQVLSAQEKRRAVARRVSRRHLMSKQWSRGESNPRAVTVRVAPLRV